MGVIHTERIQNKEIFFYCDSDAQHDLNKLDKRVIERFIKEANIALKKMLAYFPELQQKEIVIIIGKNLKASLFLTIRGRRYQIMVDVSLVERARSPDFFHEMMHKVNELLVLDKHLIKEIIGDESRTQNQIQIIYKNMINKHLSYVDKILYKKSQSFRFIIKNKFNDILVEKNISIIGARQSVRETKKICSWLIKNILSDLKHHKDKTLTELFVLYTVLGFTPSLTRQYLPKSKEYQEVKIFESEWLSLAGSLPNRYVSTQIHKEVKALLVKDILSYYKFFSAIVEKGFSIKSRKIEEDIIIPMYIFNSFGLSEITFLIRWWYDRFIYWLDKDKVYFERYF